MRKTLIILIILISTQIYADPGLEKIESFAKDYYVYKSYVPVCINGYIFIASVEGA